MVRHDSRLFFLHQTKALASGYMTMYYKCKSCNLLQRHHFEDRDCHPTGIYGEYIREGPHEDNYVGGSQIELHITYQILQAHLAKQHFKEGWTYPGASVEQKYIHAVDDISDSSLRLFGTKRQMERTGESVCQSRTRAKQQDDKRGSIETIQ